MTRRDEHDADGARRSVCGIEVADRSRGSVAPPPAVTMACRSFACLARRRARLDGSGYNATMHPMLTIAVKAARRAGNVINRGARELDLLTITSKGPKDFVSEVDREAERTIVETLLGAIPITRF